MSLKQCPGGNLPADHGNYAQKIDHRHREIIEDAPNKNTDRKIQRYVGLTAGPSQKYPHHEIGEVPDGDLGTQKTKTTLHGVPLVMIEYHLGVFFAQYRRVGEGLRVKCKAGIAFGEV